MTFSKRFWVFFLDILQTVVLALSIFIIVYFVGAQPHEVRGKSMLPNLEDSEYLLTDKLSYRLREPKRGEIVVFDSPTENDYFIKRIIALPGEAASVENGRVLVNGKELEETYLPPEFKTEPGVYISEGERISLGPDEYLVFGDNRTQSLDSRAFGPISKEDIVGRAWVVYWPPGKAGVIPTMTYAGF